jgi:hypothetical protein
MTQPTYVIVKYMSLYNMYVRESGNTNAKPIMVPSDCRGREFTPKNTIVYGPLPDDERMTIALSRALTDPAGDYLQVQETDSANTLKLSAWAAEYLITGAIKDQRYSLVDNDSSVLFVPANRKKNIKRLDAPSGPFSNYIDFPTMWIDAITMQKFTLFGNLFLRQSCRLGYDSKMDVVFVTKRHKTNDGEDKGTLITVYI